MQLTYTLWVESRHNTREGGRRENTGYKSYQEHESLSVNDLFTTGRHLLGVLFNYNKPKVKFMHSPNHTTLQKKKLYYVTRIKSTTLILPNVF